MSTPRNCFDLLRQAAESAPALIQEFDETGFAKTLAASDVVEAALRIAGGIKSEGFGETGGAAVIATGAPIEFVLGFFGAAAAGLTPIPAPTGSRSPSDRLRLEGIVRSSTPEILLTAYGDVPDDLTDACPVLNINSLAAGSQRPGRIPTAPIAFIQYSSGSVRVPKPIPIYLENLVAQLDQTRRAYLEANDSINVGWVPLSHDMGLITGVMRPLLNGYRSVLIRPDRFIRNPALWLRAIDLARGTHTSAPTFGYDICIRRVDPDETFELGSLRVARVAGELVRASTLERFANRFTDSGFDYRAFCPSYGMAEATLTVTTTPVDSPPKVLRVAEARLREGYVVEASDSEPAIDVVSCGRPLPDTSVRISGVHEMHRHCVVGEIEIAGPQVTSNAVAADARQPSDGFFATGDIGFVYEGDLYLLGRSVDRITVHGQNFYPEELEASLCDSVADVRPGRVAVLGGGDDRGSWEGVVVVAELRAPPTSREHDGATISAIRAHLAYTYGIGARVVVICPRGTLPITSSGKLRRGECLRQLRDNRLPHYAMWRTLRS